MDILEKMKVESEARRRANEDGTARVIFEKVSGKLGICLLDDFEERDVLDDALAIVWPGNEVELLF